jgi:KUP system potassium uptake protein
MSPADRIEPGTTERRAPAGALVVAAAGIVFGDIGTSPLYALKAAFGPAASLAPAAPNVLGVLSLIFWALVLVVTLKYVLFVMRADNQGEGGILALVALAAGTEPGASRRRGLLVSAGLIGAAAFFGDSVITPAISVLSAVEGLRVAAPGLGAYVVPIALAILAALFGVQSRGAAQLGRWFGPFMLLWFLLLGVLGALQIARAPEVLAAMDPRHAADLFASAPDRAALTLGAVFLTLTGAEALYADMGHFGARAVRRAWVALVWPALVLNYFGQGALLLRDASAVRDPFFLMAPAWALLPLVVVATIATVIASQAVISGTFSLTHQAVRLGFVPHLFVRHTSAREFGQIYVGAVNWLLFAAVAGVVLGFQSSQALGSAYGLAVATTMIATTVLMWRITRRLWGWPAPAITLVIGAFLSVDLAFLAANAAKLTQGAWVPLALSAAVYATMSTWIRGRQLVAAKLAADATDLRAFLAAFGAEPPQRVPGCAVFFSRTGESVPRALLHTIKHYHVLHETVALVTIATRHTPYVPANEHVALEGLGHGFHRVRAEYGFMESPDVGRLLEWTARAGLILTLPDTTFVLSREILAAEPGGAMMRWRLRLFGFLLRNGQRPADSLRLPLARTIEVGTPVEF